MQELKLILDLAAVTMTPINLGILVFLLMKISQVEYRLRMLEDLFELKIKNDRDGENAGN